MADNVIADPGSGGATFASAEFSFSGDTVQAPGSFLFGISGSEGSWTAAPINGDASNGLLVNLGSNNDVTVTGTVDLGATDNAVLDSIVTNTAYGSVTGGGVEASALRVTLANNSTGVLSVDDNGGSLTVDGTVTANLSATDNAVLDTIDAVLDTINAKLVSGTVIGDVNLGATDNAVLDNIDTNTDYGQVTGGGTETGALRVTIANNSTGVVSIDDNGGSITVDGTVDLGATDNAVLDQIVTNTTGLAGTVSGSELQVDVVAALPAGTNAIGKLAANSGVDIGDVDVTSIAAGSNLIGDVGIGVRTSGGTTPYKNLDVDETEDEVKGTAGQVYWIHAINTTAAPLYLKFYNATAASVTVGSTTPVLTLPVPANADSDGAGFTLSIPNGIAFGTAITIAATTGVADADTGAPGANALIVNLGYN